MFQGTSQWRPKAIRHTDFFITLEYREEHQARRFHLALQHLGVLTRLIEHSGLVRIGLPADAQVKDLLNRLGTASTIGM